MKRIPLILVITLCTLSLAGLAFAWGHGGKGGAWHSQSGQDYRTNSTWHQGGSGHTRMGRQFRGQQMGGGSSMCAGPMMGSMGSPSAGAYGSYSQNTGNASR